MELFLQGLFIGLTLSFLAGPILFLLLQTGIQEGFRAGIMVGLGEWISDILFILFSYYAMNHLLRISESPYFSNILGLGGGIVLISFGIGTLMKKTGKKPDSEYVRTASYAKLFLKGFSLNTFNPFTVFFWLGVTSTLVINSDWERGSVFTFYSGIIGTIIALDIVKVYSAKKLRKIMTFNRLNIIQKIIGFALIFFGIALIVRVLTL